MVPHWSFDLYFSNISDVEHLFTCLLTICIKMVVLKSLKTNSIVLLWIVWLQVILAMQFYFPDCNYQQFSSLAQSCLTLCDRMDCSMPGFPVHHQLLELTQAHALQKPEERTLLPRPQIPAPFPQGLSWWKATGLFVYSSPSSPPFPLCKSVLLPLPWGNLNERGLPWLYMC